MARITSILLIFLVVAAVFVDLTLASSWLFGSDKGMNTLSSLVVVNDDEFYTYADLDLFSV